MEICTIGFTKHSAREFFGILSAEGVERLIDVRLNNVSQLAGFAKRDAAVRMGPHREADRSWGRLLSALALRPVLSFLMITVPLLSV